MTPPPAPLFQQATSPGQAGHMSAFSTAAVPKHQRADYWYGTVFRRLDPTGRLDKHHLFQADMLRLSGDKGTELVCLSGNAIQAQRSLQRCGQDGVDDISIDFLVKGSGTTLAPAGAQRLEAGDMAVLDCAQPVQIQRADFRMITLFLPRAQVQAVTGDPAGLGGQVLPSQGLGLLLRQHLLTTLGLANSMFPAERTAAISAARDMALAILHMQAPRRIAPEHVDAGTYHAALAVISRSSANPALTPLQIAAAIGCSRATLYRAFGKQGETVGAAILQARLANAAQRLCAESTPRLPISEIAYQSGFTDYTAFTRIFKRRYGMTPSEMRRGNGR
jgi:AraC-like DNA-binding protein